MKLQTDSIQHLTLGTSAEGRRIELVRGSDETVFLAFDSRIKRLVELHLLKKGSPMDSTEKRSAVGRAEWAAALRGPTFLRILEIGEDDGVVYFTSNLADGEFIETFVARVGALSSTVTFALVLQLLEDLVRMQACHRLTANLKLDRLLVTALEDAFLHLKLCDYGLSRREVGAGDGFEGLIAQLCELLFLMLTGRVYGGEDPDSFPVLTKLPTGLRTTLRSALDGSGGATGSLERLRDQVREAFAANASALQVRHPRKQLQLTEMLHPKSHLQGVLLEGVPLVQVLGTRFRAEARAQEVRPAFSIPAVHGTTGQSLTVHLLPPNRIIDHSQYEAVPLQSWRFKPDTHPNILRSLSLWEGTDWTFLTEERLSGIALSRILADRVQLSPTEVLVILKQVRAGIDQARECGVTKLDLHPSNLFLEVGGGGLNQAREFERLMQRRIDAWPPFVLKVRPHLTMRSLCEPPLVESTAGDAAISDDLDTRRTFICLAVFLLSGERQTVDGVELPETLPEPLAAYLKDCLTKLSQLDGVPSLDAFQERFEQCLGPATDASSLSQRLQGTPVAIEEMESAGSVSDFDEEWRDDLEDEAALSYLDPTSSYEVHQGAGKRSKGSGVLLVSALLALLALLVVSLGIWLFGGRDEESTADGVEVSQPEAMVAGDTPVVQAEVSRLGVELSPETSGMVGEKATGEAVGAGSAAVQAEEKPQDVSAGGGPVLPKPLTIKKAIVPTRAELEDSRRSPRDEGPSPEGSPEEQEGKRREIDRLVNQFADE